MTQTAAPQSALLQSFILGTGRQPVPAMPHLAPGLDPADPEGMLKLLALAGQASRFDAPDAPLRFDPVSAFQDPRAIVPANARPLLLQLLTGSGVSHTDAIATSIAAALDAAKLRPHPFDVPRLSAWVARYAARLGPAAQAVANQRSDAGEMASGSGWFDPATLDDTNWGSATPALKEAYIATRRRGDPDTARALLEAQLPLEKAEVRLRLVRALSIGLSEADRPLLEKLAQDRAPTVKQMAEAQLARLPGSAQAQAAAVELAARIKLKQEGFLRRRTVAQLELPKGMKDGHHIEHWLSGQFAPVSLDALMLTLGLDLDALLAAADGDANLQAGLSYCAAAQGRMDVVARIAGTIPDGLWTRHLLIGADQLGLVGLECRLAWVEAIAGMPMVLPMPDYAHTLERLIDALEGPLPTDVARRLLLGAIWTHPDESRKLAVVASVPLDLHADLARVVAANSAVLPHRAILMSRLLSVLATEPPLVPPAQPTPSSGDPSP